MNFFTQYTSLPSCFLTVTTPHILINTYLWRYFNVWWDVTKRNGSFFRKLKYFKSLLLKYLFKNGYVFKNPSKNSQVPLNLHIYHPHHHHIALVARISLTLSRHSSLSLIALGRSSGQHPVSSHSCWMYVRAGRPAFARPCVGVHESTSLMSSSLLLQQCPACLVRLTWIVFVIGGRWPYSCCLVGCCR